MRLPKHIKVARENWVRMMYCIKHLMKLHPEYNQMIMPFYAKLYDQYPYNEDDPFNFEDNYKVRPRTSIERHLDELADLNMKERKDMDAKDLNEIILELGMRLPSWSDNKDKGKDND